MYNPSDYCCLHGGLESVLGTYARRHPGPAAEFVRVCLNELCGAQFVTANPARKYCSDRCRMRAFARRKAAGG